MSLIFNRDFDLELALEEQTARHAARASHTPEEVADAVATARAAAYAEGRSAGRAEGLAEAAGTDGALRVAALDALGPQIEMLVQSSDTHRQALEEQVLDFARTVSEQVFPELLNRHAHYRTLVQVRRALNVGLGSAMLRVALSPDALALLRCDLDALIVEKGLEGRVELRADGALADGDTRIDWDNGFLEYSFSSICDRILGALRETRSATATPILER